MMMKSQYVRLDESGLIVYWEQGADVLKFPKARRKLFSGEGQFWQGFVIGMGSDIVLIGLIAIAIRLT